MPIYTEANPNLDDNHERKVRVLTPEWFEFSDSGIAIEGYFVRREEVASQTGTGAYYHYLFDVDGKIYKFALGSCADRDFGSVLEARHLYYIRFDGKKKIDKGKFVNMFYCEEVLE